MRFSPLAILLPTAIVFSFYPKLAAQKTPPTIVQGVVTDAETREPLPFASVSVPGAPVGTRTDEKGRYLLKTERQVSELKFSYIGYEIQVLKVRPGRQQTLDVKLAPATSVLQEVVIRPERYQKKNNPARELIEEVIAHRAENHVEHLRTYRDEQYEKIFFGLSNLSDKLQDRRMMRQVRFVLENRDTSKFAGLSLVPVYLQENISDYYRQSSPRRSKRYVKATQSVRFPGMLDQNGIDNSLQYLYAEADIYDNYITLLTDQFLSPIAPGAPAVYRYYPVDTVEENGRRIVQLGFFPRNKTDQLLQGDLFIALDSTFAITRVNFSVGDGVNLNWVKDLQIEQDFQCLPNGKWVLRSEDYRMHFGLFERGAGVVGQRFVVHRNPVLDEPLPDSIFDGNDEVVKLPGADTATDPAFWTENRPEPLNSAESATYTKLDSMQQTGFYRATTAILHTAISGYATTGPWLEIGPINTFYAFNGVEGTRLRLGGRTSENLSKRWRLEGFAGYGLLDKKWKYSIGGVYALPGSEINKFPYNLLRVNYLSDVLLPVQNFQGAQSNNLFSSLVRGANDRFFYYEKFNVQYEREYANHFSWQAGVVRQQFRPAGALHFEPASGGPERFDPVVASAPFLQIRYAPGEKIYQGSAARLLIDFDYIATVQYALGRKGFFDGGYDFQRVTASVYKYTDTPPFGYNTTYLEAGGVFGRGLPYPLLSIHRGNQSYIGAQYAYNMMNFFEFISDRYATLITEHYFNGFFLNKVPLLRRLKLREICGLKVLYGRVSRANQPDESNGLYRFPTLADGTPLTYTLDRQPYVEASVGVSNIFKVVRVDLVRRFTYLDHPGVSRYGVKVGVLIVF